MSDPGACGRATGNTPLIVHEGVFVKMECANPGGSIKDRVASFLLEEAMKRGDIQPGDRVVETTSGNTGIALSLAARKLGLTVTIFMPEHMSEERKRILVRLGAELVLTPREEGFEGAVRRRDEFRGQPGHWVPDQFGNPDNTLCHRTTTGAELVAQLAELGCRSLEYFVAGVGTGGTLMGVGRALKDTMPAVRIVAVEPEESAVMSGGDPGDHGILGIGDGFIPDLVDMAEVDEVVRVSTEDARAAADEIRARHGHCVGMSAGANTVAAFRLRDRGARVATVWPDCADRYISLGLRSPGAEDVTCPLREGCRERMRIMLSEAAPSSRTSAEPGPPPAGESR